MRNSPVLPLQPILSLFFAALLPAQSGEPVPREEEKREEEVVITTAREERSLDRVPYTLTLLTRPRLRRELMARTLPEALEEEPGVMVQKTAHGHGSPYIRGFTSYRTLLLIDGVRVNNSVFRDGPNQYWNTLDPLSLARLEVVKGPASVLYGSDAVGGTVQGLTGDLVDHGEGFHWRRRVHYRFASAEHAHVGRLEVEGSAEGRLRFRIGGNLKDFGNVRAGGSGDELPKTGYEEWDGDLKLEYDLAEDAKLVFLHQRVDQDDIWRVHKTLYGKSWEGTSVGGELRRVLDQDRHLTYLQYHDRRLGNTCLRDFKASLSWQVQKEERNRLRDRSGQLRNDIQGFEVGTLGAWVQAGATTPWGEMTFGVEFYRDEVDSYGREYRDGLFHETYIQGPVGDEADHTMLAAFLQDELEPTPDLRLYLGARYTWVRVAADRVEDPDTGNPFGLDDSYGALVGSARVSWLPAGREGATIFGGLSQGFRAPNLSDLTRLDSARSNEIETPSPGLDPEYYLTFEAGVRLRRPRYAFQAAWFYTDIRDMIVRTPTGNVIGSDIEVTKRNAGDGYVHGFEGSGRWEFTEGLTLLGGFTWLYGKVDTYPTSDPVKAEEYLSRLMPPTAQVGIRWDHPDRPLWAELRGTLAGKADKLNTRDRADDQRIPPGGTPSYQVFTLRGGWEFKPGWHLTAGLENLTDQAYRVHGSGQNEPGLSFVAALNAEF